MAGWRPPGNRAVPGQRQFTDREILGGGGGGGAGGGAGGRAAKVKPTGNPWTPGPRADAAKKKHKRQFDQELGRMDAEKKARDKGILPSDMYNSMRYYKGSGGGGGGGL